MVAGILAFPQPAIAHEEDLFVFSGSGWGHSIGMSQYGAYGQASLDDATYDEIIGYYYDGVAIETLAEVVAAGHIAGDHPLVTDDTPVWVGLRQSELSVQVTAVGGDFELCQTVDGLPVCADLGWSAGLPETWEIATAEVDEIQGCEVTRVDPEPGEGEEPPIGFGTCEMTIVWGGDGQADRVALDGAICTDTGAVGRECLGRGTLQFRADQVAEGFHIALEIGVEEYMYGLGEMPSSWPEEALKAQVLAGRSYLARRVLVFEDPEAATASGPGFSDGRKASCWCHLFSSSQDQNYVGHAKEADATYSHLWMTAVDDTGGQVITHPDAAPATVILAFYHSSSGGHTESNAAVWGTTALPYLVPVVDPWSNDESVANPYVEWTISATAAELAIEMEWDEVTHIEQTSLAPDGQFEVRGTLDGEAVTDTRSAGWMYYAVGSRSPHFESVVVERFKPFLDMDGTGHSDSIFAIWEAGITLGCGDDYYWP